MSQQSFLKLDGVEGESKEPRHYGEIELVSFTWDIKHRRKASSGGGGARAQFTDLIITKRPSKASTVLRIASTSGQHFRQARLTVENVSASKSVLRSVAVDMKDLHVESMSSTGDFDMVGFTFGDMKMIE